MSSRIVTAAGGGVRPKAVQNPCPECGQQKCTKSDKGEFVSYGGSLVCMILAWIYAALHPAAVPGILVIHMNTEARRDQLVTVLSKFTGATGSTVKGKDGGAGKEIVYIVGGDPGEHGMSAEQQMHRVSADDVAKKIYVVLVYHGTKEDYAWNPSLTVMEVARVHAGFIHRTFFANWADDMGCGVTTIDVSAWDEELDKVDGFLKLRKWFDKTDAASIGTPEQYDGDLDVDQRAILRDFWPDRYRMDKHERDVRFAEGDHSVYDDVYATDEDGENGKDEA